MPTATRKGKTPLPEEVDAIFDVSCRECHSDPPRVYAPMPLVSWEDAHDFAPGHTDGPAIYELVGRRIHDKTHPMPPVTRKQLTDEQRATLDAWIDDCAPPASD